MRTNIICANCQHAWEQEVAETLLRTFCPKCGAVLDLTRLAQSAPGLSDPDKALIGLIGGIAIGLLLVNLLSPNKRRR